MINIGYDFLKKDLNKYKDLNNLNKYKDLKI